MLCGSRHSTNKVQRKYLHERHVFAFYFGFLVTFTFNGEVIYQVTNSLKDPNICFPYLGATFCADFSNMQYSTTQVTGCVVLAVSAFGFKVFSANMGCFVINLDS
eukprot:Phypoly_transcript_24236.p2 GENE.Phypoly_transcript_24236~~Phypoly_transcript_24236.p2  ORF type:complete len:105 (+),score=5.36 Phypoly_transcript_24236:179-493(+)